MIYKYVGFNVVVVNIRRLIHIGLSWVDNATGPVEGQGLPIKEGSKVIQNTSLHGFPLNCFFANNVSYIG